MLQRKKDISVTTLALLVALAAPPLAVPLVVANAALAQAPVSPPAFALPKAVPSGSTVRIDGSSSMAVINEALKQRYEQRFAGTRVELASGGTSAALKALLDGQIDLAAIGRSLTPEEQAQGLIQVPVRREKIAIIIGPNNPFRGNLSFEQFARIFRGEITNWSQVGGASRPIRFIDRPQSSDTRQAFRSYPVFKVAPFTTGATANPVAADGTAEVIQALGDDGVGYAIASQVLGQNSVQIVPMHQTLPDDRRYPFSQPLVYVYRGTPSPAVAGFLGLVTSAPGQQAMAAARAQEAEEIATETAAEATPGASVPANAEPVAFSPDGQTLVIGSVDGIVQRWDLQGDPIGQPFKAQEGAVSSLAFSADGQTLATGGNDGMVQRWDLQGQPVGQPFKALETAIGSLAFSPDGQTLATGGNDGMVRLWDLQGQPVGQPFKGLAAAVGSLAFSPDGQTIVTGGADRTVQRWNLQGQPVAQAFPGDGAMAGASERGGLSWLWWLLLLPLLGFLLWRVLKGRRSATAQPEVAGQPTSDDLPTDLPTASPAPATAANPTSGPSAANGATSAAGAVTLAATSGTEAPTRSAGDYPAVYGQATALANSGRYAEALASFDRAVELQPRDYRAWFIRGNALMSLNRPQEALLSFERALEIKPDFAEAWTAQGDTLAGLGRREQALASFERAIELNAAQPVPLLVGAVAGGGAALAMRAWLGRGNVLVGLGRPEEALASLDQALELRPEEPQAWFNRGGVLTSLGRSAEAQASFDRAAQLRSGDSRGAGFRQGATEPADLVEGTTEVAEAADLTEGTAQTAFDQTEDATVAASGGAEPTELGLNPVEAASSAAGAGATVWSAFSSGRAQSDVEAAKYDVGQGDRARAALASVDEGLADLPEGYGESRIVLLPRDPQWAYAYWDAPNEHKEALRLQGGVQLALRFYDVTDIDLNYQSSHSVQQYECEETARNWHLPVPVSDRDYVTEIGYVTGDGRWLLLARSAPTRIPPVYPSDWFEDQFISVSWQEDLRGKTFLSLVPPGRRMATGNAIYDQVFGLARSTEALRVAGSLFGSMQQTAESSYALASGVGLGYTASGVGLTASGVGLTASGMGLTASGMGLTASGVGLTASGVGLTASGVGLEYTASGLGLGYTMSGVGYTMSGLGLGYTASGVGLTASGMGLGYTISGVGYTASGVGLGYTMSGVGYTASGIGLGYTMSGVGYTMSGVGMSGVGLWASQPPIRPRQFWLVADAELIIYGATEPDATVYIGGQPIQLAPDGSFRFQMSFQDGLIDYPIMAIAADGEQQRSVHLKFVRETPSRNTNTKDEAVEEWPN